MRAVAGVAALALAIAGCGSPRSPGTAPFGFTLPSARAQLTLERRFLDLPDSKRIQHAHRELTRQPHPAGSGRDRELADWMARRFADAGMQEVQIVTHEILLPRPVEVSVEVPAPGSWRASMREDPVDDPDTHIEVTTETMPFHAFSASGDVTARAVDAGNGEKGDYQALRSRGVDVRGRIVIVRSSDPSRYVYRGYKAFLAQEHGAAGILMFPDARDEGAAHKTYPAGSAPPESAVERGSILYDFFNPGDPLTPGWPSIPGARRIDRATASSLPRIVSAPLSARDGRTLVDMLPRDPKIRIRVRIDDAIRPVWTVTGVFRGTERPDEVVILGNHRDAWGYGGADPSSGSAALVELAHAFGTLVRTGWRPRRSLMFASWDAEELALASSTEWVEQHEQWLRERAVAYLNVDTAASGSRLVAGAVPSLSRLIREVIDAVPDPQTGVALGTLLRDRIRGERSQPASPADHEIVDERPGGGSDYVPFLNHAGVPIADFAFEGPFGVYHSVYDTHQWVARFGDPGFRYHAALVRIWGLTALRLAQADVLPFDPEAAAERLAEYVRRASEAVDPENGTDFARLTKAVAVLEDAASTFTHRREAALQDQDAPAMHALNRQVLPFERAFLDAGGLEGRPWYRHLLYAPDERYHPVLLPGLAAATRSRDRRLASREIVRLAAAVHRAAAQLAGPPESPH